MAKAAWTDEEHVAAARHVAAKLDHPATSAEVAATAFNATVRTDGPLGSLAVRVGAPERINRPGAEVLETAWMTSLDDAGLPVARPIADADGVMVHPAGPGSDRLCVAASWIEGQTLREHLEAGGPSTDLLVQLGRTAALLHDHPLGPAPPGPRDLGPDAALQCGELLRFAVPDRLHEIDGRAGDLIARAVEKADIAVSAIWAEVDDARLIHGDLHPGNVMVRTGRGPGASGDGARPHRGDAPTLTVIDAQDLAWGTPLHDLAITLVALDQHDPAGDLAATFRAGYIELTEWPDVAPRVWTGLALARNLDVLAFCLVNQRRGIASYIERKVKAIERLLTRGFPTPGPLG